MTNHWNKMICNQPRHFLRATIVFLITLGMTVSITTADDFPKFSHWKGLTEVVHYTPDNLWEYINGAADQFIDYGFLTVGVGEFETNGIQFSVDIYNMENTLNAFGVFSTESKGVKDRYKIGTQAAISLPAQALMFKGKYYIKLYAFEGEFTENSGMSILNEIANNLTGNETMPTELKSLPETGRIMGSEGYTRLGFLGLSDLKNCLYADYLDKDGEKYQYFSVHPDQDQTFKEIFDNYGTDWDSQELNKYPIKFKKIPYQGMTALILLPKGLYGVSNAPSIQVVFERLKLVTK